MTNTDLVDRLQDYVPRVAGRPRHDLVGEGTQQMANEAAATHTPCVVRKGADGIWRAWHLIRPTR